MSALLIKIGAYLLFALAMAGLGAYVAGQWESNKYEKVIATDNANFQTDLAAISTAAAAQARQAVEKQQAAEQALADLDQKAQKEKNDALAENDKLRADVASGARRLRIAGTCTNSSGGGNVPAASSTTSVGNAGTIELDSAAGQSVLNIRAGAIADQAALRALQDYVMNVCRPAITAH